MRDKDNLIYVKNDGKLLLLACFIIFNHVKKQLNIYLPTYMIMVWYRQFMSRQANNYILMNQKIMAEIKDSYSGIVVLLVDASPYI